MQSAKQKEKKLALHTTNNHLFSRYTLFLGPYLLPLMAYICITLIATWPLITHLDGYVPGVGDWGQNMWALWWVRQALLVEGQHPFYTTMMFYPEGVTLLFHPLDVADGLLAIPLYGLFGSDITYNLITLLSFVLSGYGVYLLGLYFTHSRAAGFIAGLIFMLSPYHFLRLDIGHLNLATIQWIPFFVLFLFKSAIALYKLPNHNSDLHHKKNFLYPLNQVPKQLVAAIFCLIFIALHSWYYVIYSGLLALALLTYPYSPKTHHFRNRLLAISFILIASLLLLLPLLVPMFSLLASTTLVGEHEPLRHSVDLVSFWIPGPPSTWASWFEAIWLPYANLDREPGASAYIGYIVLILSCFGVISKPWRKPTRWWLIIALGFSLLAMGPQLQISGQIYDTYLPYGILASLIPGFSLAGIPGRFVVMSSLAWAMLAAYGIATIKLHITSYKLCIAVCTISFLILVEYAVFPLRLSSTTLPQVYTAMAQDDTAYTILDAKWDANYLLHAQTIHQKPLVGGWLARLPQKHANYLNQGSLDKAFVYLMLGPEGYSITDPTALQSALQAALTESDVRYIVDHDKAAGNFLEPLLGWSIVEQTEEITVYQNAK